MKVNILDASAICKVLYVALKPLGLFPALTGGTLYKEGNRKDLDIVIYRHRQLIDHFELEELHSTLVELGMTEINHYGWCTKANWGGVQVDLFNPETLQDNEEYPND